MSVCVSEGSFSGGHPRLRRRLREEDVRFGPDRAAEARYPMVPDRRDLTDL